MRGVLLGLAVGLALSAMRQALASLLFGLVLHQPDGVVGWVEVKGGFGDCFLVGVYLVGS